MVKYCQIMAMEIGAWNVAKGLGDPARATLIEQGIEQLGADVLVLSEAFATDNGSTERAVDIVGSMGDMAIRLGYRVTEAPYEDSTPNPLAPEGFEQYLAVMSRNENTTTAVIRLRHRNAISIKTYEAATDSVISGIGTHFEDRQEDLRQDMALAAARQSGRPNTPFFIAGDLNAMYRSTLPAKLAGSSIAEKLSRVAPTARFKSLGQRFVQMADGGTMLAFKNHGFVDADWEHRSTMEYFGITFGQLDHILTRNLTTSNFTVHKLHGSDHRAISATIER